MGTRPTSRTNLRNLQKATAQGSLGPFAPPPKAADIPASKRPGATLRDRKTQEEAIGITRGGTGRQGGGTKSGV